KLNEWSLPFSRHFGQGLARVFSKKPSVVPGEVTQVQQSPFKRDALYQPGLGFGLLQRTVRAVQSLVTQQLQRADTIKVMKKTFYGTVTKAKRATEVIEIDGLPKVFGEIISRFAELMLALCHAMRRRRDKAVTTAVQRRDECTGQFAFNCAADDFAIE